MRRTLLVVVGAIATTMFVGACTGDSDETPTATETVTATAVATESPTPTPEATATPEAAAADAGQMLAALLHIDSAGFHGMDEALNGDAPVIETSWLGRATRARVAAEAIVWPAELQPAADALVEHVAALEAALDADDPVAAAEPAAAAHEAQHDLSHSAYEAIEAVPASASDAGAILAALVLIDGAGFHGMDEGLNGAAPEIDPSWLGDVTSARVAAQAIAWPGESQAAANAFVDAALSLEAALEADDASAAAEPAIAAHETQHDLSHVAYDLLATVSGSADSPGAILAAMYLIDSAGFHGIDEALNSAGAVIDTSWLGATTRARVAAETVAWPDDLQAAADAFIAAAVALEAALDADDVVAAAEPAVAAHETQHDLSQNAYAHLGGGAGGGH